MEYNSKKKKKIQPQPTNFPLNIRQVFESLDALIFTSPAKPFQQSLCFIAVLYIDRTLSVRWMEESHFGRVAPDAGLGLVQ